MDQAIIYLCVSPEQVNGENGDGEQGKDCIEKESDDHSRCTRLVSSIEVPVKLGCITHRCFWAVGEALRRQRLKEKGGKKDKSVTVRCIRLDICNMRKLLPGTEIDQGKIT